MNVTSPTGAKLYWCSHCACHLPANRFTPSHRNNRSYCKSCNKHYLSSPEARSRKNDRRRLVRTMSLPALGLEIVRYVAAGRKVPSYLAERAE